MSVKDFSTAWDEAVQNALTHQENELTPEQICTAAGLRVRTGMIAGRLWGASDHCSNTCSAVCE